MPWVWVDDDGEIKGESRDCPHPKDRRIMDTKEGVYDRPGCLDCNQWLQPVRLKEPT